VEALVNDADGIAPATTWQSFRVGSEYTHSETEYDYTNRGLTSNMTATEDFFAELAQSMYDALAITYFESPCDFDSETPTGSIDPNIKAAYQLQTQFNYDNMRVYKPLLTNPNILTQPIYILFRGTSTGWDIYRDLNILLNYGSYEILQGVNTEITNIYNSLKTFIQTEGRAIHIIGHSLGCYYGLHLLHNLLIQESPNLDQFEETFNLTMFNPLILADTATEFFRSETLINSQKTSRQFAKENIAVHTIRGDFISPLLIQAGVGHIYAYDAQTERNIDTTDFLLGTWLGQITNVISRDSYLNDDNHKISSFTGHSTGINEHILIDSLYSLTTGTEVSIVSKHQTDLRVALDTDASMTEVEYNALSSVPHHLYLYDDTTNLNSGNTVVDYPHGTSTIDHYNWTIIKRDNDEFIISQVGTTKYINFEAILRPTAYTKSLEPNSLVSSSGEIYRFLVRQGINEYVMCIDNGLNAPKAFKINQNASVPNTTITYLEIPHTMLDTGTLAELDTYGEAGGITLSHRNRYILQIGATLDANNFHINTRRTNNNIPIILPPPNPFTTNDLRYYMWEANNVSTATTRGYEAIGMIGNKRHETQSDGTIIANQGLHLENGTGYVYSTIPPDKQGQWGINHNDNTVAPDEHLWKITFNSLVNGVPTYNIVNTGFNKEITNYPVIYQSMGNDFRVMVLPAPGSSNGDYWTICLASASATGIYVPNNNDTYTGSDWGDLTYIHYNRQSFSFKLL